MAAITRIRQYFWLLVVLMVLALVSFIFTAYNKGQRMGTNRTTIGKVNGKKIDWRKFQNAENILYKGASGDFLGRRAYLWNYFVEDAIVSGEAEKLGLGVSNDELNELQFSKDRRNLSDVIVQRFTNQQTRQLDQAKLDEIKKLLLNGTLNDDYKKYWTYQQKEIVKSRLQNKISALIGKAAYTPTWMAELVGQDQAKKADIAFVKIPYTAIPDDQVSLTDADYSQYLQSHKAIYERKEPTRKLAYVIFEIKPTAQDSAAQRAEMAKLGNDFASSSNDSLFILRQGGQWNSAYLTEKQLPKNIASSLLTQPIGSVVGPYISGSNYAVTKILDRKVIPDSVRSRHILISAKDQAGYNAAYQTIDSLKNLIETGKADFASLAAKFGQDATKTKGGDLGYAGPNQMVKPFNDLIFFKAEKGKLYIVSTRFGVHLVEVTGKKFDNNQTGVKMGTVSKLIAPSEATQTAVENTANQFARTNSTVDAMKAAAEKDPKIKYQESNLLKENDYFINGLGSNQTSRKFVKWAFDSGTSTGEVNPNIYLFKAPAGFYSDKAVVGGLRAKVKPGLPPVDVMKDQLKPLVMAEKKGGMIADQIKSLSDLNSIAAKYGVQVDTANNVAFAGSFIPGVGQEPKVIGATFNTALNAVSTPIVGKGGVFVIKPIRFVPSNTPPNVELVRNQQDGSFASQAKNLLMEGLKKKADISDQRSTFY